MVMAPDKTDMEPDMSPASTGAAAPNNSIPDTNPNGNNTPTPSGTDGEPDMSPSSDNQDKQITDALAAHIKELAPEDQKFLQAHMTPEFVHAMGLINGPIVEQYLNQFVDKDKVMVPVPRQVAEGLAQQQLQKMNQGNPPASPQGAPNQPPAQAPSAAPPQGPSAAQPQAPQAGGGMMPPTR